MPYCLDRDHHSCTRGTNDWRFLVDAEPAACTVRAFAGAMPYRLIMEAPARFTPVGEWDWQIFHRAEHQRGLEDTEDVYVLGRFSIELAPGATATLVLSAESELAGIGGATHEATVAAALDREQHRCVAVLEQAGTEADADSFIARLTLAADQFIVTRPVLAASATLQLILESGVGTVCEIAEGAAPCAPRGCIAQAWSVSELHA